MPQDNRPTDDSGPAPPRGKPVHAEPAASKPPNTRKRSAPPRQCSGETHPWRRRRDASRRLPVLDCGCSDPWLHRCTPPSLSEKMVDAGRDAARHLLDIGYPPILRPDTLTALHARGGDDRQLAKELFTLAGGDAA